MYSFAAFHLLKSAEPLNSYGIAFYGIRSLKNQMKSLFIVISAPSGAGKTTLCDLLLQHYPEITYSVSCTTREPRLSEEDGIDYHFMTKERFEQLIAQQQFLEHALVHGNYYGTLREPIYRALSQRQCALMDIDVEGARQIRDTLHTLPENDPLRAGYVDIFIKPPSMTALRERLEGRASDSAKTIEERVRNAERELTHAGEYMHQIINDDLDRAFRQLCDIINVRAEFI